MPSTCPVSPLVGTHGITLESGEADHVSGSVDPLPEGAVIAEEERTRVGGNWVSRNLQSFRFHLHHYVLFRTVVQSDDEHDYPDEEEGVGEEL